MGVLGLPGLEARGCRPRKLQLTVDFSPRMWFVPPPGETFFSPFVVSCLNVLPAFFMRFPSFCTPEEEVGPDHLGLHHSLAWGAPS